VNVSHPPEPLRVFSAVVAGVALVGFLVGTGAPEEPEREDAPTASTVEAPPAPTYTSLRTVPRGGGAGWTTDLDALRAAGPAALDAVRLEGTNKATDLAARAARRAYDGAPPRIPHAIRQAAAPECLSCHEEGLRFRGLLGTPMSHSLYASCTQCHVVADSPIPGGADLPADPRAVPNSFVGTASPTAGPRAWSIAPPQLPHTTWMRERCDSCHGVNGRDALRSSHPWRESCQQCHASSATLDKRPGLP
jgi:cytochrome c-type protein NapB